MAKDRIADKTEEAFDRAKDLANEAIDKAREGYETTRERIHEAKEEAGRRFERVSEAARQRYQDTAATVQRGVRKAKKDFDGLLEDTTSYIKDNPGKAVLIAAGVGFALGLLLRRRHPEEG